MADDAKTFRGGGANIYQRMHAVMQEIKYVQKEKKAGMRYSIVSHDSVTALVRPLFVKNGIVCYPTQFEMAQVGNRTQLTCAVVFQNIDDVNDRMVVASAGFGIDDQDKGPGKAISYAVKYAYLKALCLESGDDPDEDQDVVAKPGITDKRRSQIEEFKALIAGAPDMDRLNTIRDEFKPVLDDLVSDGFSAFVVEAKSKWQQKAATFKKPAAQPA